MDDTCPREKNYMKTAYCCQRFAVTCLIVMTAKVVGILENIIYYQTNLLKNCKTTHNNVAIYTKTVLHQKKFIQLVLFDC